MHRPSDDQLWQMPLFAALPIPFVLFCRLLPLEEQEASNLAASARMVSFSWVFIAVLEKLGGVSIISVFTIC